MVGGSIQPLRGESLLLDKVYKSPSSVENSKHGLFLFIIEVAIDEYTSAGPSVLRNFNPGIFGTGFLQNPGIPGFSGTGFD